MRIKMFRCGICHHWYLLSFREHCPCCGARPITINNHTVYVNDENWHHQIVRSMTQARSIAALYTELLASVLE